MSEQKKYSINYYFDGNGHVIIDAKSPEEAEEKWRNGEFSEENENEWGENFCVESIEEVKE